MKDKADKKGMNMKEWFEFINTGRTLPGKEPVVDDREVKKGAKKLKVSSKNEQPGSITRTRKLTHSKKTIFFNSQVKLSPKDIISLLRYADPDASGDLTWSGFSSAVDRVSISEGGLAAAAGKTLEKFETHMDKQKIRMLDFFRLIDKDGSGQIDGKELREGIKVVKDARGTVKKRDEEEKEEKKEEEAVYVPPPACTE